MGATLDLLRRLLDKAGYRSEFRGLPSARLYAGLRDGSVHIWPGVAGKEVLRDQVLESNRELGKLDLVLYRRPSMPALKLPEELAGRGSARVWVTRTADGRTALHYAAADGDVRVVEQLLDADGAAGHLDGEQVGFARVPLGVLATPRGEHEFRAVRRPGHETLERARQCRRCGPPRRWVAGAPALRARPWR